MRISVLNFLNQFSHQTTNHWRGFKLVATGADRLVITETCDWMIDKLNRALSEDAPPGWKGSVKAMKRHTDKFDADDDSKANPFALAWSMHKKGAKPHYKNKDGKPEKKKQYTNEDMQPIETIDFLVE